jgi:hypothetical protein
MRKLIISLFTVILIGMFTQASTCGGPTNPTNPVCTIVPKIASTIGSGVITIVGTCNKPQVVYTWMEEGIREKVLMCKDNQATNNQYAQGGPLCEALVKGTFEWIKSLPNADEKLKEAECNFTLAQMVVDAYAPQICKDAGF